MTTDSYAKACLGYPRAKAEKLHVHVLPAEEDEWMDKKMRLP